MRTNYRPWLISAILLLLILTISAPAFSPSQVFSAKGGKEGKGGNMITSPDQNGEVGLDTSLVIDASGNPVVSYLDLTGRKLKVLHCSKPTCRSSRKQPNSIVSPDNSGDRGGYSSSLVLDRQGNPVVSYRVNFDSGGGGLRVLHCGNPDCSSGNVLTTPDPGDGDYVGAYASMVLDASGNPVISYYASTTEDLRFLHCDDPNCAGAENVAVLDTEGIVGTYSSLALDGDGNPVISYADQTLDDLKVLHCNNPNCSGDQSGNITTPDTAGDVGKFTSMKLDAQGNPVIIYIDRTNSALKVLHCDDPNREGDESANIASPDSGVGHETSLALDASGYPVISYFAGQGDLSILHCGNAICTAGNRIKSPDTKAYVGLYSSIALDTEGNPVVSYYDGTNQDLKILHCGNPNC